MPAPQHLHFQPAVNDSPDRVRVKFAITRPDSDSLVQGRVEVVQSGDRVQIETYVMGIPIFSNKIDPNVSENDFDVLRAELAHIAALTIPLTSRSTDAAAAVAHAYVSAGRPEW